MVSKYIGNGNLDGPWTSSKPPKTPKKPITNTIKQKPFRKMVRDPIEVRMDLKHRLDPKTMKRLDQLRGVGEKINSVRKPIDKYAAHMAKAAKISKGINIAGVALAAGGGIYKGTKRALDNPSFHKGKAGKGYLDLSVKKPGKYGIDY